MILQIFPCFSIFIYFFFTFLNNQQQQQHLQEHLKVVEKYSGTCMYLDTIDRYITPFNAAPLCVGRGGLSTELDSFTFKFAIFHFLLKVFFLLFVCFNFQTACTLLHYPRLSQQTRSRPRRSLFACACFAAK